LTECDRYIPDTERMAVLKQVAEGKRIIEECRQMQRRSSGVPRFRGDHRDEPVVDGEVLGWDEDLNGWRARQKSGITRAVTLRD
jgi:hypothetical protein